MVRNIIFDLGGVLLNLSYPRLWEYFSALGMPGKPGDRLPVPDQWVDEYDTGILSTDEFLDAISTLAPPQVTRQQLTEGINSMLMDFPPARLEVLQRLGPRYRLFLLSNINELHIKAFEQIFADTFPGVDFHGLFEKTYYSCRLRLRKPDPAIFEYVLRDNALRAEETLFIDDTLQHIRSAETLGIQTLHLDLERGMRTEEVMRPYMAG